MSAWWLIAGAAGAAGAAVVEVPPGSHENVVAAVAGGDAAAELRLAGDATFGWLTNGLRGTIDLAGHTLTWDTGNGNDRRLDAAITGGGNVVYIGGGSHEGTLNAPGWLGGDRPNTFTGTLTVQRGTLALAKPPGVPAFGGGRLVVGQGSSNPAIVRWCNDHQLTDATALVLTGEQRVRLRLDGHAEACGTLALGADCDVLLGDGAAVVAFAASGGVPWAAGRQLVIHQWDGAAAGGGAERVSFGAGADGLTGGQLAQAGFMNPGGRPAGLYRAKLLATGELVPAGEPVVPAAPPFPVDAASVTEREKVYQVAGLEALAAAVKAGTAPRRVAFFGDSITWQANGAGDPPETANPANNFDDSHHYVDQIGRVMKRWGGASVAVFNHGLNGGGVREAEDGTEHTGGGAGKVYQPSFAELIGRDKAELAVLFLGVNDAWWRATPPAEFAAALKRMIEAARERGCKVVVATPLCIGELPDGSNPQDAALEQIVARARAVAAETGATLVDLRAAFLAWSRNHNRELKLDGSLVFRQQDLLTYDRVHLTEAGATLVANLIADGVLRAAGGAAAVPRPPPAGGFDLIPAPKSVTAGQGMLELGPSSRIVCSDELAPLAEVLAGEIKAAGGLVLARARPPARRGDIVLALDPALRGEAHALAVGESAAVKAGDYAALAAGTTTLLQLLRSEGGRVSLPRVRIEDEPSHSYRAVMIDLARKFHTIGGIEQVIRLCRLYKIRYLHLHLADDHLFMFPSQRFRGAGRSNTEFARFEPPSAPKIEPYTREELVALDRFAARHGVGIIPEIDLPGHSGRLIADERETFGFPGNGSTVHIASPKTLAAVEVLLNEVMDVFQSSPFVHLGADEVNLGGLDQTPEYRRAVAEDPAIKSPHDMYCRFIGRLHGIVTKRGRTPIVWEEAWRAEGAWPLPKDTVVMVWNQGRSPAAIARSGHRVVNTTWTPLYLVRDNKKSPQFLFDWNPTLFGREGSEEYTLLDDPAKMLGAQLTSWENSEAIEIQGLRERAAIVAERCWNTEAGGTFEQFRARFRKTDALLDRLVHPIELRAEGEFTKDEHTFRGVLTVRLAAREPGHRLRYTLDNSLPSPAWQDYTGPLTIDREVHLRAGLFDGAGRQVGLLVGGWFRPDPTAAAAPAAAAGDQTEELRGEHVTVRFRPADWRLLKDRGEFIGFLDRVYQEMADLTGHRPPMVIRGHANLGAWGTAGLDGIRIDWGCVPGLLNDFNDGKVEFGIIHEMGHVFDARDFARWYITPVCGGETFANIKLSYALERLLTPDSRYRIEFGPGGRQTGRAFNDNFYLNAGDKYLAGRESWGKMGVDALHAFHLGLVRKHGWEIYQGWFRACYLIEEQRDGRAPPDCNDPLRINVACAVLSLFAGESLVAEFQRWRMPVTDGSVLSAAERYDLKRVCAEVGRRRGRGSPLRKRPATIAADDP